LISGILGEVELIYRLHRIHETVDTRNGY